MAEILDEELTELATQQGHLLFVDPGCTVLASRHVQLDGAPSRTGQEHDLLEQLGRTAAQGDERDLQLVQARQAGE